MAFIYEELGTKERKAFCKSLGWKSWSEDKPAIITIYHKWCVDEEREMYLSDIGGNDNYGVPNYTDFYYKGKFIRMITGESYVCDEKGYAHLTWHIKNMKIPASVWEDRDIIVEAIFEAFAATVDEDFITSKAVLECEPERVDHDYNGN